MMMILVTINNYNGWISLDGMCNYRNKATVSVSFQFLSVDRPSPIMNSQNALFFFPFIFILRHTRSTAFTDVVICNQTKLKFHTST